MTYSLKTIRKIVILSIASLLIGLFTNGVRAEARVDYPYYIKVNKQQNVVTVYEKDENGKYTVPVRAMVCSVGADTPLGVFKTPIKYRWKLLMGDVWGQYSTRIVRGILFHSVWYYKMDASTLSATQYNKLGTTASHGCVRLTVEDAKWIYDNCAVGTTVEIYNGKDPGPLGKPVAAKLPVGTGWDPTDPDVNNPYNKKGPVITGVKSKSVEWGSKVDLKEGIKAVSITGTDITKDIKTVGKIDTYKAGKYKVSYTIKDLLGKETTKTATITVKQSKDAPEIKGVADKIESTDTVINRAYALKGVSAYLSVKKLSVKDIKVTITKTEDGSYKLAYSVKAENNKTAKAVATVFVDNEAPVLTGVKHRTITKEQLAAGDKEILKLAKEGVSVADNYTALTQKDIKITVQPIEDYGYFVNYEVADKFGNVTKETVQYTYFKDVRIEGAANRYDLPADATMDDISALANAKAYREDGIECTDQLMVGIAYIDDKTYEITYSLDLPEGKEITVTCYFYLTAAAPVGSVTN
ncbi:L,D-transpeptidase family protein [Anaerocolumna sp. AGMB13020]|uniref:L,D-transpeptidase family protein n=1 Tax=Anaerocolumna sp. AGMB13020 TaxID=3081750 RepID=UPI002952DB09|nr:L,D-transpeptidase family protein [Anaerocolumna sp. AGMB13020]WOO36278.1 L,D-transpeptidase family protein [Anaerocolumna sp. AGMB13020]